MLNETCPFCGNVYHLNRDTEFIKIFNFDDKGFFGGSNSDKLSSKVKVIFHKCPGCGETRIIILGFDGQFGNEQKQFNVFPISDAKNFPDCVPANIREDYEEACSIIDLSAKASGTLFRRTLEEIIIDFYGIKKGSLYKKIESLEDNSDIDVDVDIIKSLQALRQVGNIGAHLKLDTNKIPENITKEEARAMRVVIEDLIEDTYVKKHKRQEHIRRIIGIAENKSK